MSPPVFAVAQQILYEMICCNMFGSITSMKVEMARTSIQSVMVLEIGQQGPVAHHFLQEGAYHISPFGCPPRTMNSSNVQPKTLNLSQWREIYHNTLENL